MKTTHLCQAELLPIYTGETHLRGKMFMFVCLWGKPAECSLQMNASTSTTPNCHCSPPSRCACCWPSALHPQQPGTLPGAPRWTPSGQSWTRCCKVVWLPRTSCHHNNGHQPVARQTPICIKWVKEYESVSPGFRGLTC